jgi:hypothetical protein
MAYIPREKKINLGIAAFNLLAGLSVLALFFFCNYIGQSGTSTIDWNAYVASISPFFSSLNFASGSTYVTFILYFLPVLFSLLALILGRAGRLFNVLAFSSFLVTAVGTMMTSYLAGTSKSAIFNFTTLYDTYYSTLIIVALVGLVTTFINLEKSK